MYAALKHLHAACALISLAGFVLRGAWVLGGRRLPASPWVRVLPHVNDSVLLAAALALVVMSGQYPFVAPWVTAKVSGLIVYILLGALALGRAPTRGTRAACWLGALGVFAWIVSVARTRNPLGFLA